jgi:hypothetical protein
MFSGNSVSNWSNMQLQTVSNWSKKQLELS